jgi:multisubunit Na+/H+ antiporter MnhG subunit
MMKRALITQMLDRVAVHRVMLARTHALSAPFSKMAALRAARNNGEESIQ